eukprot:scaffold82588_cov63-Phaeocystis_antarctica.AAC.3
MAIVSRAHPGRIVLEVGEGGPLLAEQLLGGGGGVLPVARAACARHHCDLEIEVRHHLAHAAAEGARLLRGGARGRGGEVGLGLGVRVRVRVRG